MTQSSRLAHISRRAKEIRLAYARGDITHEERMTLLNALTARPSLWQRAKSFFFKGADS